MADLGRRAPHGRRRARPGLDRGRAGSTASGSAICKPWDLAAGIVILREAGGYVSDADGKDGMLDKGSVVAGNEPIHRHLLKLLKAAGAGARPSPPRHRLGRTAPRNVRPEVAVLRVIVFG